MDVAIDPATGNQIAMRRDDFDLPQVYAAHGLAGEQPQ